MAGLNLLLQYDVVSGKEESFLRVSSVVETCTGAVGVVWVL